MQTNPGVPSGTLVPASAPLAVTVIQPQVTIDGVAANVLFCGQAPGSVDLYQINLRVPTGP